MARTWLGHGSDVARTWLGHGSDVARTWLGVGRVYIDVNSRWFVTIGHMIGGSFAVSLCMRRFPNRNTRALRQREATRAICSSKTENYKVLGRISHRAKTNIHSWCALNRWKSFQH
eukprot:3132230-Amphidinium_carterae.1